MRHAARRFSLSGTAPPFRGRKVTATPYALRLLPRRQKMSGIDELGRCPCLPSIRQSGTYAAPGKGRARSSTEPRAPDDPGGE